MNCKRSLYAAAILAAAFVMPTAGLSQTASAPPIALPSPARAPARQAPRISEGVVAIVNDDLISTYDLRQQAIWISATTGIQPTPQNLPKLQQQALDELIDENLKNQELKRRLQMTKMSEEDFFVSDAEVDKYLTGLAEQNKLTLKEFLAQLAQRDVSAARLRRQYKIMMSWDEFFQGYYGRKIRITPEQVKTFQDQYAAAAAAPRYMISEIFIDAARAGSAQAAVNSANQYLTQIQQGAPFEAIARQFSARPTAASGGDVGWVSASELDPAVAAALAEMRAGQITRPIPVDGGAYLVLLREKSAGGGTAIITLKQAAVSLAADAGTEAAAAAQRQLLALKAKSPTCATLQSLATGMAGIEVGDLGETELTDLSPTFRTAVEKLDVDQISEPVRTNIGIHLIAVCGRRTGGANAPTVTQIENRLYGEQLEMLQRRELRNLRAAATISQPQ